MVHPLPFTKVNVITSKTVLKQATNSRYVKICCLRGDNLFVEFMNITRYVGVFSWTYSVVEMKLKTKEVVMTLLMVKQSHAVVNQYRGRHEKRAIKT